MLIHYHVKNFALIDDAEVDFGPGLNVLTGETGAGKSILIDALSAGLGARVGAEMIRRGADEALIELVFEVKDPSLLDRLKEQEIEPEDGCLLIVRKISSGRSIQRINDESVTTARLRAVTELLLDIHGQHEHQSLLKPKRQLEILDSYAGQKALRALEAAEAAYLACRQSREALQAFTLSEEERTRRLDFLNFEINEIEEAAVQPGERDALETRFREMSAFEKIEGGLNRSLGYLCEGRENAADLLMHAQRELASAEQYSDGLGDISSELATAADILSSAEHEIKNYLEESRFDPEAYYNAEKRLDELHRLELKYGDLSQPGNQALRTRLAEREELENYEIRLKQAKEQAARAEEQLDAAASALTAVRRSAAPLLDADLLRSLKELNFLSVRIETRLEELSDCGPDGRDSASILISLNPGEELRPLQKVASGGELSRIMLAIKTILADKDRIPTVIFDEIDAGISGQTAKLVGQKLKEISRFRQVILITHLPQIAAPADQHFGIEKTSEGNRTYTRVRQLTEEESIEELVRLIGGGLKSESVYRTAKELKAEA